MKQAPLSGRYELEEIVGMGGMSIVYRAWDLKYDREVAVKVLRPEFVTDEDFIRRFNCEAQAASQMSHPNIVNMYDVGQDGDTRYIVMEYVRGVTLKELIRQQGKIRPQRAVQITLRILAAIDHAHKNNIVHRDIKPQNILMDREINVKVADFGIAREVNSSSGTLAGNGSIMGSVHYFSPEQANGLPADEKSDLYSVGVVLYEMVTGQVPFNGEAGIAVALKHINEKPLDPSVLNDEVSRGLSEVILKALEKDSSQRYQNAIEFATDLKRALKMPSGGFVRKYVDSRGATAKTNVRPLFKSLFILLLAMIATAAAFSGWKLYERLSTRVRIPNVLLAVSEDAIAQLETLGLKCVVAEAYSNEIAAGVVFEQSTPEGLFAYPGDEIQITVSKGKEFIKVPAVAGLGLTRSEAVSILEEIGLMSGEVVLEISDEKIGTVIRQEPLAGEKVSPFTEIVLYVSGERAVVPDLEGLTVELARSTLAASGFLLDDDIQEKLDEAEPGMVIGQTVPPGEMALLGEKIGVVISQIMPETYYAQTVITVTVPNEGDEVLCILVGSDGEPREVYCDHAEAGNQTIALNLDSYEEGEQVLSVYVNEELVIEKTILFESN